MAEVVKLSMLSGKPVPDAKKKLMERFEEDVAKMREWLEQTEAGGFAVVAYDLTTDAEGPKVHSWVNFFCNHPADVFWLPDMVKTRVWQRAHGQRAHE